MAFKKFGDAQEITKIITPSEVDEKSILLDPKQVASKLENARRKAASGSIDVPLGEPAKQALSENEMGLAEMLGLEEKKN